MPETTRSKPRRSFVLYACAALGLLLSCYGAWLTGRQERARRLVQEVAAVELGDVFDAAGSAGSADWRWTRVNGRRGDVPLNVNPRLFNFLPGRHEIVFQVREANTLLDKLIVTNQLDYWPNDERAVPASGPATIYLTLEAEAGRLTPPLRAEGEHIAAPANFAGAVAYEFEVPVTGDYVVWCRVRANAAAQNSFFVSADLDAEQLVNAEAAAREAVRLTPANAAAHYALGTVLARAGEQIEAGKAFTQATKLRPRDFFLWLERGRAEHQHGDEAAALTSLQRAVTAAPYYAQPRWELGEALFRAGRRTEALVEWRRAATSDEELFPALVERAWQVCGGAPAAVAEAVQPRTQAEREQLERFIAEQK